MNFLCLDKIHHTYFTPKTATNALSDISFEVNEGEFISFIGPSGCGKTTLLSIIAGLIKPTEGKVLLHGKPVGSGKNQMGYMLQQDYLFPWKTIEENIFLGLKIMETFSNEKKQKVYELLEELGLSGVETSYPRELSGGMRQRVALIRTLITEPEILLLDEPFSALDYQTKLKLEDLIFTTLKALNKTAVLVTHDIGEAIAMSDRIILFASKPGRVHKVFEVPQELKELKPFTVRNHEAYPPFFQTIWKELEGLESGNH
ncbi:ABC transporter ATP-binding protein [Rossellomorea aquimaris]|uniref:ABC transporter ATP-binding protein n=1 Tax=Rossellomorea aquimaris TaxID=189382 RepID=UPI001CD432A9|nr:ABC transporter ATP-binding protein [Rossellomorea aquimaris]MCA1056808.1 ABC transporter ATP-binding protein [Rossellomorea aquimaris]